MVYLVESDKYVFFCIQQVLCCSSYELLLKVVIRRGRLFDIVDGASFRTMCFTKAYSHYAEGTGSVVLVRIEFVVLLRLARFVVLK